ncbi:MAG TPA: hypothetical protein VN628_07850 [Vicinamibacterales bacterium]|nr:hypothetical protein [Vicinamibacterales bacterium]
MGWTGGIGRIGIALLVLAAAPVSAQWLRYPTDGIPRKNGRPDLTAKTPRLPDGKPDLSGIWHAGNRIPCTNEINRFIDCGSEIGGSKLTLDLGLDLPGGSLPYQPWAAALKKQRAADDSRDDPHVRCLPDTIPRMWTLPHLTKAIHTPKLLVLLYEVNATYRQIFLDGRPFPQEMNPEWMGYSVGHWDGDTLVVETRGFRDNLWIDMQGSPMSDQAKMTERIRRPNFGTLDIDLTIDDAKTYTKPFTIKLTQTLEPDTELADEFCLENEKSYDRMQRSRGK